MNENKAKVSKLAIIVVVVLLLATGAVIFLCLNNKNNANESNNNQNQVENKHGNQEGNKQENNLDQRQVTYSEGKDLEEIINGIYWYMDGNYKGIVNKNTNIDTGSKYVSIKCSFSSGEDVTLCLDGKTTIADEKVLLSVQTGKELVKAEKISEVSNGMYIALKDKKNILYNLEGKELIRADYIGYNAALGYITFERGNLKLYSSDMKVISLEPSKISKEFTLENVYAYTKDVYANANYSDIIFKGNANYNEYFTSSNTANDKIILVLRNEQKAYIINGNEIEELKGTNFYERKLEGKQKEEYLKASDFETVILSDNRNYYELQSNGYDIELDEKKLLFNRNSKPLYTIDGINVKQARLNFMVAGSSNTGAYLITVLNDKNELYAYNIDYNEFSENKKAAKLCYTRLLAKDVESFDVIEGNNLSLTKSEGQNLAIVIKKTNGDAYVQFEKELLQ